MSTHRSDANSRSGKPERISDLLQPALERLGPKGVWTETKLRKVWQEVVGDQVSPHAHVRRLRGRTLEVSVDSDAWATELTYLATTLIERLNRRLGSGTVAEIAVRKTRRSRR
jgi:predicted nucleic acid-binding Zn ribbon protein